MKRTYSRKGSHRRPSTHDETRIEAETNADAEDEFGSTSSLRPRKRQKVSVEVTSPARILQPADTLPDLVVSNGTSSPHTPTGSARDLSALFDAGSRPQSSTPPKGGGIVKRMLSKSRTEEIIEPASPSPKPSPRRVPSSTFPVTPDKNAPLDSTSASPSKATQTRHSRTYAGTSRSFLIALPAPADLPSTSEHPLSLSRDPSQDDMEMRESYTDLRTRWGVDNSEDDPRPYTEPSGSQHPPKRANGSIPVALANGMMNDLKSITELRSKGESRRFLDEVGYLFEGLDSSGAVSLRRASALEVVTKLCDPEFSRRAKAADFYGRTWDVLYEARANGGDKIFDSTLAFFAALAAHDDHTLNEVAQRPGFISTLLDILASSDHSKDVLGFIFSGADAVTLKSRGILRTEVPALNALGDVISKKSRFEPSSTEISTRFLVSQTLAALPPSLLDVRHVPIVLSSLQSELDLLPSRITAYISALPLIPSKRTFNVDIPSFDHIENSLRLLDSFLLNQWSSTNSDNPQLPVSNQGEAALQFVSVCLAADIAMRDSDHQHPSARKCLCVALKILTVLSHDNRSWCRASLRDDATLPLIMHIIIRSQNRWSDLQRSSEQSVTENAEAFDLLCLALGLFMNWASAFQDVKNMSRKLHIDPSCSGTRLCVKTCQCPDQRSVLECLTLVYIEHRKSHHDLTPESSFLRGYIAVLLGLLIQDCPRNQPLVFALLDGRSLRGKLKSLIDDSRAFAQLYADLTVQLSTADEGDDDESTKKTPERSRGEDIAAGVIASLEALRDNT